MSDVVLHADDDPIIRQSVHDLLTLEGFTVHSVENGIAALGRLSEVDPDVVLLDVEMPLLDGFGACRTIKEDPATAFIPVVLVTGLTGLDDRLTGIEAGANDFLTKPFEEAELLARVRSLVQLKKQTDELERAEEVLFALANAIEGKDPYTEGHCERLAEYSAALGAKMGLSEESIHALRRAGVVHDIGKVAIPDSILKKDGPLNDEEFDVIRSHPVVGEEICAPLKSFKAVLPIIRHHHERMDGSGYPDGLAGQAIPFTARVMTIVDVYDALTTERPYKMALSQEEALAIMEEEARRGWWDKQILGVWTEMVTEGELEGLVDA